MVYVGCYNCRRIGRLICSGQFMPHISVYAKGTDFGVYCPICGHIPLFTCSYCGLRQRIYAYASSPQIVVF